MTINKHLNVATTALLVFCTMVLFFMPIFDHQFGYINDYTIFEYNNHQCCFGFPETTQLFAIGRPLQAILLNIQLLFVSDIQSLQPMRLFFVSLIGFTASFFFIYIQSYLYISRYGAAILALLTFTLPSMVINSFWVAQSIPGIVPIFLVILAHAWMQKWNVHNGSSNALIIGGVFALIFSSLLIYPPATFFFLTLTFIKLIFGTKEPGRALLRHLAVEVAVMAAACMAYFLSIKYVLKPLLLLSSFGGMDFKSHYHSIDVANSAYSFTLSFDLDKKITRIHDLFVMVISAWFPQLSSRILIPFAIIFVLISVWASVRSPYLRRFKTSSKIFFGLVLSMVIPCITAIPVLVGQGDYPILYRVVFASMAVVPVAIVFAMDRALAAGRSWLAVVPILAVSAGLILAAEISSYHRLKRMVSRLSAEYRHVQDALSDQTSAGEKEIRIPPFSSPPDPSGFLYQDFGYTAVNSITTGMVNAAARTTGRNIEGFRIIYDPLGPRYQADISEGITFNRDGYPSFVSGYKGISGKESFGRWTDSEEAVIEFAQPLPTNFSLKITAGTSSSVVGKPIQLIVGSAKLETRFAKEEASTVEIPVATNGKATSIILKFPKTKSPMELGLGGDSRHLGLALIKISIDS